MKTLAVKAEAERAQRVEQSNFVAMLAHELNSPLTVIGALADANTRRAEPGNLPAAAASAIDEMRAVIDKCVQATRVEEAGLVLAHEECDVRALIHASSVHLASDRFHVDVRAETDTWVESDPAVLTTIVSNLLENALKYGAPGTPVDVVVHGASQGDVPGLAVRVTNPCGPAGAPDADRVFQKFYRGDGAGAFRGSGLGLFISSKLAAMLGGALSLETAQGAVTFALWVPARRNMT
jgi:signal transduction histidine kinase